MANFPKGFVPDSQELPEGFVPDAEPDSPELDAIGPESFLHPDKFKPSPSHRKFKNQTGSLEQIRSRTAAEKTKYPTDLAATLDMASAPIYSMADRATLGAVTGGIRGYGGPTADRWMKEIENYRRSPASNYGDLPAYLIGGPEMVAGAVERALPQVVNRGAQAARALLGSGLTSAGISGAEAASRGEDLPEIAREAGRGYVGGTAVGAPLTAAGALMRGAADTVLGSKGAKAREYLDARGQPLTAPNTSDEAIGAAGARGDEAVKARLGAYKGEVATGPYTEEINRIPQKLADKPVNMTPVYRDLQLAANDPANLQVADKLQTLVKMLGDRPLMTQQEANGLRRSLAGIAGVGDTTAGKLAPLRRAYESVKAIVDQGPYAEANRKFASGMEDFNNSLDMVGLRSTNNPDEPIAGNLRVKLQRAGQNTVTAGGDTEALDLEAFKAKHPELANAIDAPEIIRKQGDLSFNLTGPSHGGFIERTGLHLSAPIMAAMAYMGHGLKGAAAIPLALALQNRNAIAGRYLYGPAQNAQIAAQMLLGQAPQLAAPGGELTQERR